MARTETPINLALQGGGSHGALTWGVLDRLLEEPDLRIAEISGTSAGAMNAVVLAHGLARDGRQGARTALHQFWKAISDAARFSPIQRAPWERMGGEYSLDNSPGYLMMSWLSQIASPQMWNPLGLNPLRDILAGIVDFPAVNASRDLRLHLCATNVRTGQPQVFGNGRISCDAVMASACLPQMYAPVEIDGEAYWDGGFSASPALGPLIVNSPVRDLLLVKLNPLRRERLPASAREIANRMNEISFSTSLVKELRMLELLRQLHGDGALPDYPGADLRLHIIHCETDVQELSASSKLNAEWSYLQNLFGRGRDWAQDWLERHRADVGLRSSFHLDELFVPGDLPPTLKPLGTA